MANDLRIKADVVPVLDEQAANATIKKIQSLSGRVKTGQHTQSVAQLEKEVKNLVATLVYTGRALTTTSGRIQTEQLMGGGLSPQVKAALRSGADQAGGALRKGLISPYTSFSEGQIKRLMPVAQSTATSYNELLQKFLREKENPTQEGTSTLLGNISILRRDVLKLYQEYRIQGRRVPKILQQIAQNTSGMKKEASDWKTPSITEATTSGGGVLNFLKNFAKVGIGVTSIAGLLKKGKDSLQLALERGEQALRLRAAYGESVNWGDVRARAGMFNMSVESAMAPNKYAADFGQRMMWGEISEREIIGLSRAGRWGRMVMSGEAARNPGAANAAFESMVASTNPAKMRSILRQLGLPEDVMNYRLQPYNEQDRKEYEKAFREIADKELLAAEALYDAGNQLQVAGESISKFIADEAGILVQTASPQGRRVLERLTGKPADVLAADYSMKRATSPIMNTMYAMKGIFGGDYSGLVNNLKNLSGNTVNNNLTTNITIQGNADEQTVDELQDAVSRSSAISSWLEQTKQMGGLTSYGD